MSRAPSSRAVSLAGPLEFECQVMHIQDTDQRLIAYVAAPGSPTRQAFARLAMELCRQDSR